MKISIVTTTWNSGTTVRDTIESVLAQTWYNIEYIIVDGASCDNTMAIVHEYEPLFNGRMRYISEPDNGIYDAMNKGIGMATGDVVGFLNSDDFFTSNDIIAQVVAALSDPDTDGVYGDVHYVEDNDVGKCVRYYSSKCFRPWHMHFGFMPAHPSFYCRRNVYHKLGKFDTTIRQASDFECLLRFLYMHTIKTEYIATDFVTMRMGGASSSGFQSYKQALKDKLLALRKNEIYSNTVFLITGYFIKCINQAMFKLKI